MGRYYHLSNGDEGKFWFACQPSDDVCLFGGQEASDCIRWEWSEGDLDFINKVLKVFTTKMPEETGYTYPAFRRQINKQECSSSSALPETQTEKWKRAELFCARIILGCKIRRGIRKEGYLSVEAEC